MEKKSRKWRVLETQEIFKTPFFRFRRDQCQLPDGKIMPRYFIMEFADWVNIVPVTSDGKIVLIEQYRHAAEEVAIEIPGGATHPGQSEDPRDAALRELREETGYASSKLELVASHFPNPALQNNRLHTFLARDCVRVGEPQLDPYEDIHVVTKTIPETIELIYSGEISHSLIIASLFLALPRLGVRSL